MILCGGKGTRLGDMTKITPKPMVKIGPDPIVWHIIKWYSAFGSTRFILCLGYMKEIFEEYFEKHSAAIRRLGLDIKLVDTGAETATGGRVWQAAKHLPEDCAEFFLTYGDGVSNVDLAKLLSKHRHCRRSITISGVHPPSRFGELVIKGDRVTNFEEKGYSKSYINGGFMVVTRKFLDNFLTQDTKMFFEQAPMHEAALAGEMSIYRHEGFWQCMDTPREYAFLNNLWKNGDAPWKVSK